MKIRTSPESMCAFDGVLFVRVKSLSDGYCKDAGDGALASLADEAIRIADKASDLAGTKPVKVVLGKHSIEVHSFEHCVVVVCHEIGCSVVKSIRRMTRKVGRAYNRVDFRGPEQTASTDRAVWFE